MNERKRVYAAIEHRPPDVAPVEYHPSPGGFFEHGARLQELWRQHPDDFGPSDRFPLCAPPAGAIDTDGRYSEDRQDEWGVVHRHMVFGAAGIPVRQPLNDWSRWKDFRPPRAPACWGEDFEAERARAEQHRRRYFLKSGWISLFELMHSLRSFESVLTDIAEDCAEIHRLADLLTEYQASYIRYLLARGVDAVQFGDDFGTQTSLVLSPKMWRSFFKPRYERLVAEVHSGSAKVFFHSCGCVRALLDELADLGVDAIWPQLNTYRLTDLARWCRENRIAIALHPDRGDLMIRSGPDEVRRSVLQLAELFTMDQGGAWFYVEIDSGFPFPNVVALTEAIAGLREGG